MMSVVTTICVTVRKGPGGQGAGGEGGGHTQVLHDQHHHTNLTIAPRLKEKMKLHETKLKKLGMMEAKIHQMEKGPH